MKRLEWTHYLGQGVTITPDAGAAVVLMLPGTTVTVGEGVGQGELSGSVIFQLTELSCLLT